MYIYEHNVTVVVCNWYQQCVTVHHVPKCMSSHKAIVVITLRAHCFHNYISNPISLVTLNNCPFRRRNKSRRTSPKT